jgi:hypothetical protein
MDLNHRCVAAILFAVAQRYTASVIRCCVKGKVETCNARRKLDCLKQSSSSAGKIHMPRQRADDCSSRTLPLRTTNACLSMSRFVRGFGFLIGNCSGFFVQQNFFTGQTLHFG